MKVFHFALCTLKHVKAIEMKLNSATDRSRQAQARRDRH
ncbi:hypothetical protein C7S15_5463 [Burkholderia cepacia]|nr:hypothetical protein [Burkholderia cepacia]